MQGDPGRSVMSAWPRRWRCAAERVGVCQCQCRRRHAEQRGGGSAGEPARETGTCFAGRAAQRAPSRVGRAHQEGPCAAHGSAQGADGPSERLATRKHKYKTPIITKIGQKSVALDTLRRYRRGSSAWGPAPRAGGAGHEPGPRMRIALGGRGFRTWSGHVQRRPRVPPGHPPVSRRTLIGAAGALGIAATALRALPAEAQTRAGTGAGVAPGVPGQQRGRIQRHQVRREDLRRPVPRRSGPARRSRLRPEARRPERGD